MGTEYTVLGRRIRIHDREEWQIPSQAITPPPFPSPELVHWGICHYPGAASNWVPPLDTASHLRWANALYLADPNRGYSYGYGFVIGANPVDWLADTVVFDTWEVRGFDIRVASNNGDFPPWSSFEDPNFNGRSLSVQIMCSFDHPATDHQRLQFRYMMALCDQVYGETVTVQPHQTSDQTDCPGPCMDVMAELATRPTPFAPTPTPQEDKLLFVNKIDKDHFEVGDTIWARAYDGTQINNVIGKFAALGHPLIDYKSGLPVSEPEEVSAAQGARQLGKLVSDADDRVEQVK